MRIRSSLFLESWCLFLFFGVEYILEQIVYECVSLSVDSFILDFDILLLVVLLVVVLPVIVIELELIARALSLDFSFAIVHLGLALRSLTL